jgi:hypothetical protein
LPPMSRRSRKVPRLPKARRVDVTREEFNHVVELINQRSEIIESHGKELDIQFRRIGQLQAALDEVKRILQKLVPR